VSDSGLRRRLQFPDKFRRYGRHHPIRGSLIFGLVWGIPMFVVLSAASLFTYPADTLKAVGVATVGMVCVSLITNLWQGRRERATQ
jgi:hypothetical protein